MEKAERERLLLLFHKRMDLVRSGAALFREGKIKEAAQNYYNYIDVLERTKSVEKGKISPRDFDKDKDIAELLLLSGVYWDLAKMHDRATGKNADKLRHYLDRFVTFSKGLPYQKVSSELVRKYLVNGKPKNRKEFKDAHIQLGGGKCFMVTAVEDYCDSETLPVLRQFRDQVLLPNRFGKAGVMVYYVIGPRLARLVLKTPEKFQRKLARVFDGIAARVR